MALSIGRVVAEVSQNIRHTFVSAKTQSANATRVSKDEWNAAHLSIDAEMGYMPGLYDDALSAGVTEPWGGGALGVNGENRWLKRLQYSSQIRLQATVITGQAATLILQYTTDLTGASGWTTTGSSISLATAGLISSAFVDVPTAAKASAGVLMRWVISA